MYLEVKDLKKSYGEGGGYETGGRKIIFYLLPTLFLIFFAEENDEQ